MIGPLAIAPQIAQLHDDMRRANVLSGVDSFKEKLRGGQVNYIMYVDNDMATFKAARWRGIMQEKDAEKMSREIGFHIEKRENGALANQIELYAKKYGNVKNPELNAAITTALVPFLQTSLGSLMESKIETVYPKDFDHRDFARFMQGAVTVPAYSYVSDMRALKDNYKSAGYDEDQVYELELDATIAHDTFAPMPYSVDGVKEWTDGIYVFFWSKREIDMSDHARLVSYIGDTLGGDIQVIFMSGDDPMKGHIFDGHAEMRIWAYLRLRDTDLLKAKVSGINGGR